MEGTAPRVVAGRYTLVRRIGAGGMGEVWEGRDDMLDRSVAVKIVPTRVREGDSAGRLRALREARAASRLNHPGAVTIHDVAEDSEHLYIMMELVRAPDLSALVRGSGPLNPERAATIGLDLLHVLEAAHAAGITHRDVKPSNVMVLPGDRVKLTDFGIASIQDDTQLTMSGTVIGSPAYMSPEQAGGYRAGPPADLWGLGATLYYAVEGRAPFDRVSPVAVAAAVLTQPPDQTVLAGPLAPVLRALMSRPVEQRPDAATTRRLLGDVASGTATVTLDDQVPPTRRAERNRTGIVPPPTPHPTPPPTPPEPHRDVPPTGPIPITPAYGSPAQTRSDATREAFASTPAVHLPNRGQPPVPPSRRRGTFLAAAAGGVLVGVLLVVQFVVPALSGGRSGTEDRETATGQTSGSQGTANGSGSGSGSASGQVASGSGAGSGSGSGSGGPLGEGSPAATGAVPLVAQSGAWPGQTLPENFRSATNTAGGYRVGVPVAFTASATGATTYVEWRENTFDQVFEVRRYGSGDPLDRLRAHRTAFTKAHGDTYAEVRLTDDWTYHGQDAAAWEFTYTRNGEKVHAREVALQLGGRTFTVFYRVKATWWMAGGTAGYVEGFEQAFALVT